MVGTCRAERAWLDLVADLLQEPLVELPEERIALQLHETFGANGCAFHSRTGSLQAVQRIWPPTLFSPRRRDELNWWSVHRAPRWHPVLRYYLATHDATATQVADVPSVFAGPRVVAAWNEIGREYAIGAQVALPLHFAADGHRAFVLGREDVFTPGEMALVRRLQYLLAGLDRQVQVLARAHADGLDAGAGAALPLTARELSVLSLVAEGLTSAAAARRLLIAERTVHKHLERIYAKLGVSDRVSAVLRAQRAGVLAARSG
jgi:DNA-binding CsgD family transcriptional regulator